MTSAAVLTVSDAASVNRLLDSSGPAAVDFLTGRGYHVLHVAIVPDDPQLIRQSINAWVRDSAHPVHLVVTTGGTGFGMRDVTPEVLNLLWLSSGFVSLISIPDRRPCPL